MTEPPREPASLEHGAATYLNATMFLLFALLLFGLLAWNTYKEFPDLIQAVADDDERLLGLLRLAGRAIFLFWSAIFVRWAWRRCQSI